MSSTIIATNVINDDSVSATNAGVIAVEDTMEVTVTAAAVAFLVVEYIFMRILEKWKN